MQQSLLELKGLEWTLYRHTPCDRKRNEGRMG